MVKKRGLLLIRILVGIGILSTIGFYAMVDTAMWGGSPGRIMASTETGLPAEWDP